MTDEQIMLAGSVLLGGPPLVGAVFIFAFRARPDVIDLHEVNLRLVGIAVLSGAIVAANAAVGTTILLTTYPCGLWPLVFAIGAFIPPILAALSYLSLNWRYRRTYGNWLPVESLQEGRAVLQTVEELSEEMELRCPPVVRISPQTGISPFCYGRSARRMNLVLPVDFVKVSDNAC